MAEKPTVEEANADFVKSYTNYLSPNNPKNPLKKSYRDITSADLKDFGDKDLDLIRSVLKTEDYKNIDQMLPSSMSRGEYYRAILRELASRNIISEPFERASTDPNYKKPVTVVRTAFGKADALPSEVTNSPAVISIRDSSIDMVVNNTPYFGLKDDVARKAGLSNTGVVYIDTDARAYDFGYMAGAMPEFKRNDGLNMRITSPLPADQIQQKYCPVIENLFKPGRAYDNRDAMVLGFMQARVDGKNNFSPISDRVGLFAECPKTPSVSNALAENKIVRR